MTTPAHVAIQIRDRVIELCTGLTTTGTAVYKRPMYPLSKQVTRAVIVALGPESVQSVSVLSRASRKYQRTRTIDVTAVVRAKEADDVEGLLAVISSEVEAALPLTAIGPWNTITLSGILSHFDMDEDIPAGQWTLRYEAVYFTVEGAPGTAV